MAQATATTRWRRLWPLRRKDCHLKLWGPFLAAALCLLWIAATLRWSSKASVPSNSRLDQEPTRNTRSPGSNELMKILRERMGHPSMKDWVNTDSKTETSQLPLDTFDMKNETKSQELNSKRDMKIIGENKENKMVPLKHKLRFDWTNLPVQSPLAKDMLAHQTNCSLPLGNFKYRNRFGLGSDLHVWGQGTYSSLTWDILLSGHQACGTILF